MSSFFSNSQVSLSQSPLALSESTTNIEGFSCESDFTVGIHHAIHSATKLDILHPSLKLNPAPWKALEPADKRPTNSFIQVSSQLRTSCLIRECGQHSAAAMLFHPDPRPWQTAAVLPSSRPRWDRGCESASSRLCSPAGFRKAANKKTNKKVEERKKTWQVQKMFFLLLACHAYCKKERMTKDYCFDKGQGYILCWVRKFQKTPEYLWNFNF